MIVLDTHIWIWWVHQDSHLPSPYAEYIQAHESDSLCISAISCWEVAKLVERGRLNLPFVVDEWLRRALAEPGIELIALSPQISVASTQLPGQFHRDPADQIITATARVLDCSLVTLDLKIRDYPHVNTQPE